MKKPSVLPAAPDQHPMQSVLIAADGTRTTITGKELEISGLGWGVTIPLTAHSQHRDGLLVRAGTGDEGKADADRHFRLSIHPLAANVVKVCLVPLADE